MITYYQHLPEHVQIGADAVEVNTNFTIWVEFEQLLLNNLFDESGDNEQALYKVLFAFKDEELIKNAVKYNVLHPAELLKSLIWFYRCGDERDLSEEEEKPQRIASVLSAAPSRVCDYKQDAPYIYASFRHIYGINLMETPLHWWEFRALVDGLPEEARLSKIIKYRTMSTKDVIAKHKASLLKLKRLYSLDKDSSPRLTLEQRNQAMKDYIAQRMKKE